MGSTRRLRDQVAVRDGWPNLRDNGTYAWRLAEPGSHEGGNGHVEGQSRQTREVLSVLLRDGDVIAAVLRRGAAVTRSPTFDAAEYLHACDEKLVNANEVPLSLTMRGTQLSAKSYRETSGLRPARRQVWMPTRIRRGTGT